MTLDGTLWCIILDGAELHSQMPADKFLGSSKAVQSYVDWF